MHNGVVSNFSTIKRALCNEISEAAFSRINGGTDSEHLAALYMTYLTRGSDDDGAFTAQYDIPD